MKEENPWNIHSLYDLLYFNCPSCAYKNPVKQEFIDHAYQLHPESERYLQNISDGSLSDVEIPSYYDHDEEMKVNIVKVEDENICNICDLTFCNQTLLQEHENLAHPSGILCNNEEYYNDGTDNYEYDEDIKTEQFEDTKDDDTTGKTCTTFFPKISKYEKYFEINHITRKVTCRMCTKKLSMSYHGARYHLKSQHQIILEKGRPSKKALEKVNRPEKYECETCDKSFQTEQEMNDHFLKIHKKMKCPECHRFFRSKIALDQHINLKHNENPDLEFKVQCEKCDKMVAKSRYQHHLFKKHGALKKEKCEYCELEFDDIKTLRVHFRTEHSDIPGNYKCQLCGKSFMAKERVTEHQIKVHNKKFQCQACGHSVSHRKDLELHIKRQHEGIETEKINCEICGKTLTKSSIKSHLARVHGEGGQKCKCKVENCGKEFNHPQQLREHMAKVHSNGKNIVQCKICGKLLSHATSLKKHIKIVHEGIKDYKCEVCGKASSLLCNLKTHIKTVHEKN